MKKWQENYGEDADGNRGTKVWMFELDDTDEEREEIAQILYEKDITSEDGGMIEINYEDMDIEVDVSEYTSELKSLEAVAVAEEADRLMDERDNIGDQIHEQRKAERDE